MTIRLDGHFWERHFKKLFIPQINVFCDATIERVMPLFDNIEEEADSVVQAEYERYGSLPATGEESWDMADAAEWAQEIGLAHYEALTGVRQSLINLAVVALYHMFEQQLLLFHRKQVLHRTEKDNISLIGIGKLKMQLKDVGVDIEKLRPWEEVNELRLAANSIKHAEGDSAQKLKKLRPDLFVSPYLQNENLSPSHSPKVLMPLAGEDIYSTTKDLKKYQSALVSFWDDFGAAIKLHS